MKTNSIFRSWMNSCSLKIPRVPNHLRPVPRSKIVPINQHQILLTNLRAPSRKMKMRTFWT